MDFFKASKLNLYLLNGKAPAQRVGANLVPLGKWDTLKDFSKLTKQIRKGDNFGFLAGRQFATNQFIINLDFDIHDDASGGEHVPTANLYKEFEQLDTNGKKGFFSGSTCPNYGVLCDITNNEVLMAKFAECQKYNKSKLIIEKLEVFFGANVALPPSKTNCKKCHREHKAREFLNAEPAFCVPNEAQTEYILALCNRFIASKTSTSTTGNAKASNIVAKSSLMEVNRIHKRKMLIILECLKDSRFTVSQNDGWGQLLVQVANANNEEEVIRKFWERCRIGKYSNVSYAEIANAFAAVKIAETFNNANLYKMAKEDNPTMYNAHFHKYDEPDFDYQKMTFLDEEGKPTHFINYEQTMKYFEDTQYRFIKSGLGTGKTTLIKNRIKQRDIQAYAQDTITKETYKKEIEAFPRVLFLTMRQSLARTLMEDFEEMGFANYLDKAMKSQIRFQERVIISIDSLEKLGSFDEYTGEWKGQTYNLVICDEICSLLKHYDFKEMREPEKSYSIFQYLIRESQECYFMDGDLSNREIKWFNNYVKREGDFVRPPLFNAITGNKRHLKMSYCKAGQYSKILEALEAGKNIAIVCMSSTECIKMYDALGNKYKCKMIHGNSSDAEKEELGRINSIITNYQCFIYSPSITVGIDINPKKDGKIYQYFDEIFGYVCEGSVCPRDYFQMLARIRNPKCNVINILIANFDMQITGLFDIKPFDNFYRQIYQQERVNALTYIKMWNKWETDHSKYWLDIFAWYAEQKGHMLEFETSTKANFAEAKQKLHEAEERLNINIMSVDKAEMIFDAVLLRSKPRKVIDKNSFEKEDEEIYKQIANKRIITEEDKEMLMAIDERNNWDNVEYKCEMIKNGEAMTHDKLNVEKSIYWSFFGLSNDISFEEFKDKYYRQIEVVKMYNLMMNSTYNEGNQDFDNTMMREKVKYLKQILPMIGANSMENQIIRGEYDIAPVSAILSSEHYKTIFGIMDKSNGSKKIVDKRKILDVDLVEKVMTKLQVASKLRELFALFGFEYHSKQMRINGKREYVYEFCRCAAVEKYLAKGVALAEPAQSVQQVEYDF
jgi:Origin of replication binding protein